MHYIPSKKLNDEPLHVSLSGIAQTPLFNTPDGHRDWFWRKLAGTGLNKTEINRIADAVRYGTIVFIRDESGNYDRAYIEGTLVESPTQHITWNVSPPVLSGYTRANLTFETWRDEDSDYIRQGGE